MGNDFGLLKKNPFQYQNALRLIAVNLSLHIIQLITLFSKQGLFIDGQLAGVQFASLVVGLFLVMFLMSIVFPKRVLAKANKLYKGTSWENRSKMVAFGYLFCNLILLILIWLWRHWPIAPSLLA